MDESKPLVRGDVSAQGYIRVASRVASARVPAPRVALRPNATDGAFRATVGKRFRPVVFVD